MQKLATLKETVSFWSTLQEKLNTLLDLIELAISDNDMDFREVKIRRDVNCPLCGDNPSVTELIDYEIFCGISVDSDG